MTITDSLIFCGFVLIVFGGTVFIASMMDRRTEKMKTMISDVELVVILDGLRMFEREATHPTDKLIAAELTERLINERKREDDKSGSDQAGKE